MNGKLNLSKNQSMDGLRAAKANRKGRWKGRCLDVQSLASLFVPPISYTLIRPSASTAVYLLSFSLLLDLLFFWLLDFSKRGGRIFG